MASLHIEPDTKGPSYLHAYNASGYYNEFNPFLKIISQIALIPTMSKAGIYIFESPGQR